MKQLLLDQFSRYPKMELADMVKLVCQNEFAGGHIISSPEESFKRLEAELKTMQPYKSVFPHLFEDIGNGLCRFHLAAMVPLGLEASTMNRLFVGTSRAVSGSMQSYRQKLRVLQQCCESGALPFSPSEAGTYIKQAHTAKSCPLLSHSEAYREAYHPSYRVIKSICSVYIEAFKKIDALLRHRSMVTVAVDGPSAAGKSSFAALLGEMYDCNIFHMDDFFLPPERKTARRLSEAGGNVDYERFAKDVLAGLQSGKSFSYRPYSCKLNALGSPLHVTPKPLNIIEGVYSLHPSFSHHYDLKLFIDVSREEQSTRILQRNGAVMHRRFMQEWIPLENQYFGAFSIKNKCDIIFLPNF